MATAPEASGLLIADGVGTGKTVEARWRRSRPVQLPLSGGSRQRQHRRHRRADPQRLRRAYPAHGRNDPRPDRHERVKGTTSTPARRRGRRRQPPRQLITWAYAERRYSSEHYILEIFALLSELLCQFVQVRLDY